MKLFYQLCYSLPMRYDVLYRKLVICSLTALKVFICRKCSLIALKVSIILFSDTAFFFGNTFWEMVDELYLCKPPSVTSRSKCNNKGQLWKKNRSRLKTISCKSFCWTAQIVQFFFLRWSNNLWTKQ